MSAVHLQFCCFDFEAERFQVLPLDHKRKTNGNNDITVAPDWTGFVHNTHYSIWNHRNCPNSCRDFSYNCTNYNYTYYFKHNSRYNYCICNIHSFTTNDSFSYMFCHPTNCCTNYF
ncbi:hypothetical protein SRHO_G00253660 [Serrasalmus rhombeus]